MIIFIGSSLVTKFSPQSHGDTELFLIGSIRFERISEINLCDSVSQWHFSTIVHDDSVRNG